MSKDERYDVTQYDDVLEIWGYEEPTDEQIQRIEKLLSEVPDILGALKKAYEEIDHLMESEEDLQTWLQEHNFALWQKWTESASE